MSLSGRKLRQIFASLRLGAIGIDRIHHQRRLHRHRRAVSGIDALELARDQSIGDVAETRAAILFRNGGPKQPELAHLGQHAGIVCFVAKRFDHARHQIALRKPARGVAHHALVFGKLAFKIERVFPHERCVLQHRGHTTAFLGRLRHEASLEFLAPL